MDNNNSKTKDEKKTTNEEQEKKGSKNETNDKRKDAQGDKSPKSGKHPKPGKQSKPKKPNKDDDKDGKNGKQAKFKPYPFTNDMPNSNDWKFYAPTEAIARQAGSLPWNYMGGTNLPLSFLDRASTTEFTGRSLASVLKINYVPSIGITSKGVDGVNMASKQLYTFIRKNNSGAANYEAPDLMMTCLMMRDIYTNYCELRRVLGLIKRFALKNHNLPDLVITALGFDPDDIRENYAQYVARLNLLALKINSFAMPSYFTMNLRAAYISNNVFGDSKSIEGQFYVFCKTGYFTWTPIAETTGSSLTYKTYGFSANTRLSAYFDIVEGQIDSLFLDEDVNIMSGDILKAFGANGIYQLSLMDTDSYTEIIYDENILMQIHNSHCALIVPDVLSYNSVNSTFNVTQSNQLIQWEPVIKYTYTAANSELTNGSEVYFDRIALNSIKADPLYTDVLEWTRCITLGQSDISISGTEASVTYTPFTCGLELVINYHLFYYSGTNVARTVLVNYVDANTLKSNFVAEAIIDQFDWRPLMYYFDTGDNAIHVNGDVKIITTVDVTTLTKINDMANYAAVYGVNLYNIGPKTK